MGGVFIMFERNLVLNRGWVEMFKKTEALSCNEILDCVAKLEQRFRLWMGVTLGISLFGILFWSVAYSSHDGSSEMGLYIALVGITGNYTTKLSTQIRLSALWTLWDMRRREESELRRSIAEDL
jgi:hypothetical protein